VELVAAAEMRILTQIGDFQLRCRYRQLLETWLMIALAYRAIELYLRVIVKEERMEGKISLQHKICLSS
jgi:hypothetical protein